MTGYTGSTSQHSLRKILESQVIADIAFAMTTVWRHKSSCENYKRHYYASVHDYKKLLDL